LVGTSGGSLIGDFATGHIEIHNGHGWAGGLTGVGTNIERSHADVDIDASKSRKEQAGGLAGSIGAVDECYATGTIAVGNSGSAGGLVGGQFQSGIQDSYATGTVTGGSGARIGGLTGAESEERSIFQTVQTSYSSGAVSGGASSLVGGFVGLTNKDTRFTDAYWDTTSSGTNKAAGKGKTKDIEGLTTQQLQSGLPAGFDPSIWAESKKINNGLPYLINNPPAK
jgi:hypothetical protein